MASQERECVQTQCCGIGGDRFHLARGKWPETKGKVALMAKEMNELSVQEREELYEEIHGVNPPLQETPGMIEESLKKLKKAISEMSRSKRIAYNRAVFLRPFLEHDTKFQLMFLRADRHDARLAARRMCQYFTDKLELFGVEKLAKDITLDDLDEDDMEAIKGGSYQILERKDQSGRPIGVMAENFSRFKHWKNAVRQIWYHTMAAIEDEQSQISGNVAVMYFVDMNTENLSPDMMSKGGPILSNLPFRSNCVHFCYNDPRIRPVMELLQIAIGRQRRLRFRTHFGSHQECMYTLMSFGIPTADFPIRMDGTSNLDYSCKFLQKRKELEAARTVEAQASENILYPGPLDVLLGRGRPFHEYHGNNLLAVLIDKNTQRYSQATARMGGKGTICFELVISIQSSGGRFLQRTNDGWTQVSVEVAREKVSNGFRTHTKRQSQMGSVSSQPKDNHGGASNPSNEVGDQESNKRVRYDDRVYADAMDRLPHNK